MKPLILPVRFPHTPNLFIAKKASELMAYGNLCVGVSFVCKNVYFACFMRPECRQAILGIFSFISASFTTNIHQNRLSCLAWFPCRKHFAKGWRIRLRNFFRHKEEISCVYAEDLDISRHAIASEHILCIYTS